MSQRLGRREKPRGHLPVHKWPTKEWGSGLVLRFLSLLSLLGVWVLSSSLLSSDILPGPLETLEFVGREYGRGSLLFHLWVTTQRVLIAFGAAMVLGTLVGVTMGTRRWLDGLLEAWLVAGLTVPRIVLFVVAYLLLGLNDFAAVTALILTVIPTIVVQIREGTKALDSRLLEMARAYRRTPLAIWRHVVFPQLLPYVIGTARGALSLAWKMVVLAELLGRTSGVGYQISFYFQMFNMTGIMAYGLTMMVVLSLIDLSFMAAMQHYAFRWRRPAKLTW